MAISMLKIRRPLGRLIFNMGIAIPGKTVFPPDRLQTIIWTNADPVQWCIYATLWGDELTHFGPRMHIYASELCHHCLRYLLVASSVPSYYLNQCRLLVIWILANKFQGNINWNSIVFLQEKMLKILSAKWWPFCIRFKVLISHHTVFQVKF